MSYEYTTVGHVTADEFPDGERRPGGGAFYSALQAARLGLRTLVLTRGVPHEIEELLAPWLGELDVRIEPAPATTVLATAARSGPRRQRVVSWAGPFSAPPAVDCGILHLAPVAAECPLEWRGEASFVGLTPQGIARGWGDDGLIGHAAAGAAYLPLAARCAALVLNARELPHCQALVDATREAGGVVAVTNASGSNVVYSSRGEREVPVPAVDDTVDDLGAGDVYAAAFFTELAAGTAPHRAAEFANFAAALRVSAFGADAVAPRAAIERAVGSSAER